MSLPKPTTREYREAILDAARSFYGDIKAAADRLEQKRRIAYRAVIEAEKALGILGESEHENSI